MPTHRARYTLPGNSWLNDDDRRRLAIKAALVRRALAELLGDIPWTHIIDQSFAPKHQTGGNVSTLHYYAGVLARLPPWCRPHRAWMVVEQHPTHRTLRHLHGFWAMRPPYRHRNKWWSACKEYLGERYGWARVWRFAGYGMANAAKRLEYPLKHTLKGHPTRPELCSALYTVQSYKGGGASVRYPWRGSWWSALGDYRAKAVVPGRKER